MLSDVFTISVLGLFYIGRFLSPSFQDFFYKFENITHFSSEATLYLQIYVCLSVTLGGKLYLRFICEETKEGEDIGLFIALVPNVF